MKKENKFIPLNLSSRISSDDVITEKNILQDDEPINATDFVYFELENEWLQEYELIYNSYKLEQ
jgi:hypothetical protein